MEFAKEKVGFNIRYRGKRYIGDNIKMKGKKGKYK